jgi:hypothetical protein
MLSAAALAATAPLWAVADPTPQELEQNRLRLARYAANPPSYARLRQGLADFLALPEATRERLRTLDHDLHQESPYTQARLFDVMERYADWLDRLPAADRDRVQQAPNRKQRLQVIREILDRQWMERLPQAVRERIARAPEPQRQKLIRQERNKEAFRRGDWRNAMNHWDDVLRRQPLKLSDLPPGLRAFVREVLLSRLNEADQLRLTRALDNRAQFPRVLVELADKHPPALPGNQGPTQADQLPGFLRTRVEQLERVKPPVREPRKRMLEALRKRLKEAEGKWPEYGSAVVAVVRFFKPKNNVDPLMPFELWPTAPKDLSPPVRQFLERRLIQVLDEQEKKQLLDSQGKWPEFPLTIQGLAQKHHLRVPWLTLPAGPREQWDLYRLKPRAGQDDLPPLSRQTLRLFALVELTPKERADLGLSSFDRTSWQRLKQEYFKRKPGEKKRLQQAERLHKQGKGKAQTK